MAHGLHQDQDIGSRKPLDGPFLPQAASSAFVCTVNAQDTLKSEQQVVQDAMCRKTKQCPTGDRAEGKAQAQALELSRQVSVSATAV